MVEIPAWPVAGATGRAALLARAVAFALTPSPLGRI